MRSFDPRAVGRLECRAWETYYRRKWLACLVAFVALVRAAFRMSWPQTLAGALLVLRANVRWARLPVNDPEGARALMTRFYGLVRDSEGSSLDPAQRGPARGRMVARAPRGPARRRRARGA